MTILEQIKKAYGMNYGAVIEDYVHDDKFNVIGHVARGFILNTGAIINYSTIGLMKILGYKYLGELGGNQEIEEGQRFKTNEENDNQILTFKHDGICKDYGSSIYIPAGIFDKSHIEPIF